MAAVGAEVGVAPEELSSEVIEEYDRRKKAEIESKYRVVSIRRVVSADDFGPGGRAEAMQFAVSSGSEEARDVAAELEAFVRDLLDVGADLEPVELRGA